MKQFSTIQTNDYFLQKIQDNVGVIVNPIAGNPISSGTWLYSVALTAGANTINHALGAIPTFVMIGLPSMQATIWLTASSASSITVNTSANCTITFYLG